MAERDKPVETYTVPSTFVTLTVNFPAPASSVASVGVTGSAACCNADNA